jgi:MotA/TolQ/ExbB proton channel family
MTISPVMMTSGLTITSLENLLFYLAQACLWPVMALILLAFAFAMLSLGGFAWEFLLRFREPSRLFLLSSEDAVSIERMELKILKELEGLRLCSRIAPMLGLVATMIPLGPALVAVASGHPEQSQSVITSLAPAFAAVIVALVAASLTFAIHTVRRRWLLEEMTRLVEATPS